jgi:hypothetical protein
LRPMKADDGCDRCDIVDKIEIELVVKRRVDRARRAEEAQRIIVTSIAILVVSPLSPAWRGFYFFRTAAWGSEQGKRREPLAW